MFVFFTFRLILKIGIYSYRPDIKGEIEGKGGEGSVRKTRITSTKLNKYNNWQELRKSNEKCVGVLFVTCS